MISRFYNNEEIPFDLLFEGSLPKMDEGTYSWREGMSVEDKRNQITVFTQSLIDQPNFLGYKLTIDEQIVLVVYGLRREDDLWASLCLARPINGSRSRILNEDTRISRADWFREMGIKRLIGFMPDNSTLKESMETRNGWVPEYERVPPPMSQDLCAFVQWEDN